MKPVMALIIGSLYVALCVVGYLYYQRTSNDIIIELPKVELKNSPCRPSLDQPVIEAALLCGVRSRC